MLFGSIKASMRSKKSSMRKATTWRINMPDCVPHCRRNTKILWSYIIRWANWIWVRMRGMQEQISGILLDEKMRINPILCRQMCRCEVLPRKSMRGWCMCAALSSETRADWLVCSCDLLGAFDLCKRKMYECFKMIFLLLLW
jgi:hypothetical protein